MPYISRLSAGTYRVQWRDGAGRRHSKTFATERIARHYGEEREAEVRKGAFTDPRQGRVKLAEWHREWWESRVVEQSTERVDAGRIRLHILPEFGDVPIADIAHSQVQAWVKRLVRSGLAGDTVRSCHRLLASMLAAAVRDGRIVNNVAKDVELPPAGVGHEVYLTRDEVHAVVESMEDETYRLAVLVLAYTGLRWGELAGLHRKRINLPGQTLDVVEVHIGAANELNTAVKEPCLHAWLGRFQHRRSVIFIPFGRFVFANRLSNFGNTAFQALSFNLHKGGLG